MIALTFALPDESRAFVATLENRSVPADQSRALPLVSGRCGTEPVIVAHTGVGEVALYRQRLEALLAGAHTGGVKPRLLISSGYAGGLQPGGSVGDLILGDNVSGPEILRRAAELLRPRNVRAGRLVTRPAIAETMEAKRTLGLETGAIAVDMESAWIAQACAQAGVPMLSLRVISDAVHQAFPVPGSVLFDAHKQRPRYVALPAWLLTHPWQIAPFVRFVRGLGPARARLTGALRTVIAEI